MFSATRFQAFSCHRSCGKFAGLRLRSCRLCFWVSYVIEGSSELLLAVLKPQTKWHIDHFVSPSALLAIPAAAADVLLSNRASERGLEEATAI
jgi:hypothetical protein